MQHRLDNAERTAYYRKQAAACATAALATAIAEVKRAYLDLEQGWLCLAPKAEGSSNVSAPVKGINDADSQSDRASSSNAPHDLTG
jgi:hypothetical protein